MPIYEYRCSTCHRTYEVMQKLSDVPLTVCVNCSGKLTKLISTSGLVFKGSGFYINDYAVKGKEKGKGPDKSAEKEAKTSKTEEPASTEKEKSTEKDKKTGTGSPPPVSE